MKRTTWKAILCSAVIAAGCHKIDSADTPAAGETDTETTTETASSTTSPADTETTTETASSTPDTSEDTGVDTDSSARVSQPPIEFVVRNTSDTALYVDGWRPFRFRFPGDPLGGAPRFELPFCSFRCDDVPDASPDCCIACERMIPGVRRIAAGESLAFRWDGRVHEFNEKRCQCGCYDSVLPFAGFYELEITAASAFTCIEEWIDFTNCAGEGAAADDINGAELDPGHSRSHIVAFELPTQETGVALEIR